MDTTLLHSKRTVGSRTGFAQGNVNAIQGQSAMNSLWSVACQLELELLLYMLAQSSLRQDPH